MAKNSDITHDEGRGDSPHPASGIDTCQPGRLKVERLVRIPELRSAQRLSGELADQVVLTTRSQTSVQPSYSLQGAV